MAVRWKLSTSGKRWGGTQATYSDSRRCYSKTHRKKVPSRNKFKLNSNLEPLLLSLAEDHLQSTRCQSDCPHTQPPTIVNCGQLCSTVVSTAQPWSTVPHQPATHLVQVGAHVSRRLIGLLQLSDARSTLCLLLWVPVVHGDEVQVVVSWRDMTGDEMKEMRRGV